jgi:hypothetical protein
MQAFDQTEIRCTALDVRLWMYGFGCTALDVWLWMYGFGCMASVLMIPDVRTGASVMRLGGFDAI